MADNDPSRLKLGALLLPLPIVLFVFYVLPFLGVLGWSVTLPEPGIEQYQRIMTDPAIHDVLWRTFRLCTTVSVISLVIAYLMAYCWVYSPPFWQRVVEICVFIPFWLSVLVRAFGWLIALRSNGLLNDWLQYLGITNEPLQLTRNELGVVIGMVHFMVPFALFPLVADRRTRWLLAGLLIYLALPIDLVPDFIPVLGYADDAVAIVLVVRWAIRHAGLDRIESHWPGSEAGLRSLLALTGVRR